MKTLVFMGALLALPSCGSGVYWQQLAPGKHRLSCAHSGDCTEAAVDLCPYGYYERSAETRYTGTTAHTSVVGTSAFTQFRDHYQSVVVAECAKPKFCESSACPSTLRCKRSERFRGRKVCAAR